MMATIKIENNILQIKAVDEGIFRVKYATDGNFYESLLEKYNFLMEPENEYEYENTVEEGEKTVIKSGKVKVTVDKNARTVSFEREGVSFSAILPEKAVSGYHFEFTLNEKERIYGLGDNGRDSLNRRGKKYEIWLENVERYSPIPYFMSSRGWGVLLNSTFRQNVDMGADIADKIQIDAPKGTVDFHVFMSDSMLDTIELYTRITGKPLVLPRFGYGSTQIMNMEINQGELLRECLNFRREDVPRDVVSLEPKWMNGWNGLFYNFSTEKKWNPEKFLHPTFLPENTAEYSTMFFNLRKMGFKFTLWLCNRYDLLWEEERTNVIKKNNLERKHYCDPWAGYNTLEDQVTKPGEPWFEHLKKFLDNGAVGFKLDGADQVFEHPDKLWGGKYTDDEVHNIYPLIYARQMQQGFKDYTGRRPLIFTVALYSGSQHYAASWAGDTGGRQGSLISILNLALSGHSNASSDILHTPTGLHFGFLIPWTEDDTWTSWRLPWYMGDEDEGYMRRYAKLRSSLFPYIYSMAHKAAKKAIPMARPMCLMYPEDEAIAESMNTYMFGDSLLVGAFDMNMRLPEGKWYDIFSGKVYEGGKEFAYEVPEGWGGALFAKEGGIWVTQNPKDYIEKETGEDLIINVFPGKDGEFHLIEDDGITYKYLNDEYATTSMYIKQNSEDEFELKVNKRTGGYSVDSPVPYDIMEMGENHSANVKPLADITGFKVRIYTDKAMNVTLNGKSVCAEFENNVLMFNISKEDHENGDLVYTIK